MTQASSQTWVFCREVRRACVIWTKHNVGGFLRPDPPTAIALNLLTLFAKPDQGLVSAIGADS